MLGGWSPGPLPDVLAALAAEGMEIVEVAIPMPPAGCLWLVNPFCAAILVYVFVGVPRLIGLAQSAFSPSSPLAAVLIALICLVSLVVLRLLVAGLVRFSIAHGMWLTRRAMHRPGAAQVLLVGFSWGGGVVHALLARETMRNNGFRGPALLLAPTTTAMCSAALLRWPRLRGADVEVVHALQDGFCPDAQVDAYRQTGHTVHTVSDAHTLDSPRSIDLIVSAALSLSLGDVRANQSASMMTITATGATKS